MTARSSFAGCGYCPAPGVRGPCNATPSEAARGFARMTQVALNADSFHSRRVCALQAAKAARANLPPFEKPGVVRPLDRRFRHELRMVLAWCAKRADVGPASPALLRSAITGFRHAMGPQLFPQLAPGDALQLVREADNPYDARAVRIDWRGHKLGYVSRSDNPDIARRLDAGEMLTAAITTVAQDAGAWDPVEFEVTPA